MVVLFRLIKTIVLGRLRTRIGFLDESAITMRVWPNDLDANVHMNSGRYLSMMDLGRMDLLVRMRLFRRVIAKKWRPVAGAAMIRYRRSLLPFEKFRVVSRLVCWDEKWFYFEHRMENAKGELSAHAYVRGVMVGPDGSLPSSALAEMTGSDLQSPPMPEAIARWREAEAAR